WYLSHGSLPYLSLLACSTVLRLQRWHLRGTLCSTVDLANRLPSCVATSPRAYHTRQECQACTQARCHSENLSAGPVRARVRSQCRRRSYGSVRTIWSM